MSSLALLSIDGTVSVPELVPSVVNALQSNGVALVTRFAVPRSDTAEHCKAEGNPARSDTADIDSRLNELGSMLGTIVAQSPRGELIEDVRDMSDMEEHDERGYRSGGELVPHSDPPTLIVLYSVTQAKQGGESYLVKVSDVHDAIGVEYPDLLQVLYEPFPMWRVDGQFGRPAGPYEDGMPVFCEQNGIVSCAVYRPFIERAAEALQIPLSSLQVAALDAFDRYSEDERLVTRFMLQPGDLMVLHNRTVLHARTNYEDYPELRRRRHLKRLWIDAPQLLPVHPMHQLGDIFAHE